MEEISKYIRPAHCDGYIAEINGTKRHFDDYAAAAVWVAGELEKCSMEEKQK